jgi:hypothetical protein
LPTFIFSSRTGKHPSPSIDVEQLKVCWGHMGKNFHSDIFGPRHSPSFESLYGGKIIKIRAIENLTLGHL